MGRQRSVFSLMRKLRFLSVRRRMELYPPFWMMRVKVLELDKGWDKIRLKLPLNLISANSGGNMYGGYQANLADPIPAFACSHHFPGYRIVTKKLVLEFIRPGDSDLELVFKFGPMQKQDIARQLEESGQADLEFEFAYYRADGKPCTLIRNTVAIRPRRE